MSRVITFSRTFPAYHPKAGQPTYFVEKFTRSRILMGERPCDISDEIFSTEMYYICEPKNHTIRAGSRWKVGDKFSPRVWSGKPYQSKQIIIAPDIEIKKTWDFTIDLISPSICLNGFPLGSNNLIEIATNDGLNVDELLAWFKFPKPYTGQIICWNENVNY